MLSWPQHPYWLACKVALPVALIGALGALMLQASWPVIGLSAAGLGGVAYGFVWWMVARRLRQFRTTLKHLRAHQFEALSDSPSPRGDELDALLWELYQTGQMISREIDDMRRMETYRREFIGNVSHELKTPIFSIQGFTETLLDGALEDETVNRSFLEKIMRNTQRLDQLASDLSQIARIETEQLALEIEAVDIESLMHEVIEMLGPKAEKHDITLRSTVPSALPPAHADRERIRQVLANLTENAIKYNTASGYVHLRAKHVGEGVRVAVEDDGIGIAPEHLNRLTERFYRVDKSRARHRGGSGLGLSIVKHLLGAHNTQLQIESVEGQGSTFAFELPVSADAAGRVSHAPN